MNNENKMNQGKFQKDNPQKNKVQQMSQYSRLRLFNV